MMYFNLPASVETYSAYFPAANDARPDSYACYGTYIGEDICTDILTVAPTAEICCNIPRVVAYGAFAGWGCQPCVSM